MKSAKLLNRKVFSSSVSIIISLSLVLFVVGLLAFILINTVKLSNYVKENIGFTIMLNESVKDIDVIQFQKTISAAKFAKNTTFISKEEATIELQNDLGEDFVQFLGYSPLLPSLDVKLNANYANSDSLDIIKKDLDTYNIVHEVYYQKNLIDKLNKNVKKISLFLLSFCILLFIISFALINNTIRLSVYSKRFIIRTMGLVGATNKFIQKPFLTTSLYHGFYSAIFAIFLLIGTIQLIQKETATILNMNDLKMISIIFILIFGAGIVVSWVSTFFAVKKYTQINEHELYN